MPSEIEMFENNTKAQNTSWKNLNLIMQQQISQSMKENSSHRQRLLERQQGRNVKGQRNANTSQSDLRPVCNRQRMPFIVLALFILASIELVEGALRNVNLIIEPPAVRRGQHAVLRCEYDLEKAPLYSAKFYRGQLEFYRYTPGEFPNTKVFPFPGIHVDVTSSNATQVLIRNVGFGLSGNFSCEVTADAPLFSTATAIGMMQVVELPEKRPTLFTEHTRYEPGDVLRANCTTPPSRPRAELKFFINNMVVTNAETQYMRTIDNLIASSISLKLQLQGVHFSSVNPLNIYSGTGSPGYGQMLNSVHGYGHGGNHGGSGSSTGGGLVLRCTAQIGELYQEYKEIELGTPQKDPVPARVTLSSGSSMKNFFSSYFSAAPGQHASAASSVCMLLSAALLAYSRTAAAVVATALLALMAAINSLRLLLSPLSSSPPSLPRNNKTPETHSDAVATEVAAEAPRQLRCRQRRLLSQR